LPLEPKLKDTILADVFKSPITIFCAMQWYSARMMGIDYSIAEKKQLTCKAMGLSKMEWDEADADEQEELLGKELWLAVNLKEWEAEVGIDRAGPKSGKQKRLDRKKKKGPLGNVSMLE